MNIEEEFIPILKLGYMSESSCPAALECEECSELEISPLGVASLLVAAFECLSLDVKESKEIEFEKETIKLFLKQMKNRAEHVETFKYDN